MEMQDVKIKVYIKDKGNLIANANISVNTILFGFITIKGFQIWKSPHFNERLQEAINIQPPSKLVFGKYIIQVYFENRDKWFELEQMIYDAFNSERRKNSSIHESEDVNTDEIPL